MLCELEDMFCSLVVEKPRLQTELRQVISNTVKACDVTRRIINNEGNSAYNQKSLSLIKIKGEKLASETLRLLTSLAGEAGHPAHSNSRKIVCGSLVISNMEKIMRILSRMAEIRMELAKMEESALSVEIVSLTITTLEALKTCLSRLSSSFKGVAYINDISVNIDFERKIQHAFETAVDKDDLDNSYKALEMIGSVESLNRSINWCGKY